MFCILPLHIRRTGTYLFVLLLSLLIVSVPAQRRSAPNERGQSKAQALAQPAAAIEITTTLDTTAPPTPAGATSSSTGTQTGRVVRNSVTSVCSSLKSNPGLNDVNPNRRYDAYVITPGTSGCLSVTLTNAPATLHAVVYNSGGFVATSPSANFHADYGSSATSVTFTFSVTAGQQFTVVVHEVNVGAGVGTSYTLRIDELHTLTVDNTGDLASKSACSSAPDDCSLRGALVTAVDADTIQFDPSVFGTPQTIQLPNGELLVNDNNLTINGPGATRLTLQNTQASASTSRVLQITGNTVRISGMTITGGNPTGAGGGILVGAGGFALTDSIVTGNSTTAAGGGIKLTSPATLTNVTVSNNTSVSGGGGIDVDSGGNVLLTNSTVSGNASAGTNSAGGIFSAGIVSVIHCTITNNSATSGAGGIYRTGTTNAQFVILGSTVVAGNVNNTTVPDIETAGTGTPPFSSSGGSNLIGNPGSVTVFVNGVGGEKVGTAAAPLDPVLAPLGNYGGGTFTHPLLANSPAKESGNPSLAPATDQRGVSRTGVADIGSYELNPTVTSALPSGKVGAPYSHVIVPDTTMRGTTYGYCYNGTLPPGLTFSGMAPCVGGPLPERPTEELSAAPNAAVTLAGTPTTQGTFNLTLTIQPGTPTSITIPLRITIASLLTASEVVISGRVISRRGMGLARARVQIADSRGNIYTTETDPQGRYTFTSVPGGDTYIVSAEARGHTFAQKVVPVSDNISDLDFSP